MIKTIMENVKSFMEKEEPAAQPPKQVPDAAVEMFEQPVQQTVGEPPKPPKKLPFSAAQLRQKLQKQPKPTPEPAAEPAQEDISSQIAEFERSISDVGGEGPASPPEQAEQAAEPPLQQSRLTSMPGFFNEFSESLKKEGYPMDEALRSQEVLNKMKAFHERRILSTKHLEQQKILEEDLTKKLAELQDLERDWTQKQEEIMVARSRVGEIEHAITARTAELKHHVSSLRSHMDEQPSIVANEFSHASFTLASGAILYSLPDLRKALLSMDATTFNHHVSAQRNDFATWIQDAFKDERLAQQVQQARSREELAALLQEA